MSVKPPAKKNKNKKRKKKTAVILPHPLYYRRDRLLPAAVLAAAVFAGLMGYGLPPWQCLCWALAFGVLLPLGVTLAVRVAVGTALQDGQQHGVADLV